MSDRVSGMFAVAMVTAFAGWRIVWFQLAGGAGAFVHAPKGIDGLCYNEGNAGHVRGDWYYKVDD